MRKTYLTQMKAAQEVLMTRVNKAKWAPKRKGSSMPRQLLISVPIEPKKEKETLETSKIYMIHASDLRTYVQCRQKWDWASGLRRGLEPARPYIPFFFGHVAHDGLDIFYNPTNQGIQIPATLGDTPKQITLMEAVQTSIDFHTQRVKKANPTIEQWPHEWEPFQLALEQAYGVMLQYDRWRTNPIYQDSPLNDANLRWLATETKFQTYLLDPNGNKVDGVMLEGRFDGIVQRIDDGTIWVFENKTSAMPTQLARSLDRDNQCSMYTLAASRLLDRPVSGLIYNILNKKVPTEPKVLASGGLSKQKRIATSYECYLNAIHREHPTWTDQQIGEHYGEILGILIDTKSDTFVNRMMVPRSQTELHNFEVDTYHKAMEMIKPDIPIYRSETPNNCLQCYFRDPCLSKFQGRNHELILDNEYQERVHWISLTSATELTHDLDVDASLSWR